MSEEQEVTDQDREQIAQLVLEGYECGTIDSEGGHRIYWELKANKFKYG